MAWPHELAGGTSGRKQVQSILASPATFRQIPIMKIAMFDTHAYEREPFDEANKQAGHSITYLEPRLTNSTVALARGHEVICSFVNDRLDAEVLQSLAAAGTKLVALRSAGYNHVDLAAAARLELPVVRVPE